MGTHGHSPLGNLVLGSVVSGVLARSDKPVLLVR
jgi:nucleotide-binding universal stress UspA family protein